jgi:hypothetical protein
MRRSIGVVQGLAVLLIAPCALAESYDEPSCDKDLPSWRPDWDCDDIALAAIAVYGAGSMAALDAYELDLAAGEDEPSPLADRALSLDGRGYLGGGGVRFTAQSEGGFRFGLGLGLFHLGGVTLGHDPLPEGVSAGADDALAGNVEFSFGKAFDARYFYPYIDLKGSVNIVSATVDLAIEPHGYVGSTQYIVPSFTAAPRLGAFVPIDGDFFVDLGGSYGLFGMEGLGGYAAFGIWDNM